MPLQRDISKIGLLFTAVGGIVGSGWLLGPFYSAQVAGPAAIISWILGGLLMMVIAFTFAELATSFPVAGGMVRFAQFSHGALTSFTMAWISWLAAVMVAPIETMAALQYAGNYIPGIMHMHATHATLTSLGMLLAGALMLLMCIVNCFAVKYFAKSNSTIVVWKLAIPIITIFVLLAHVFHMKNFTQFGGFAPNGLRGILSALPTAGVIFSFIGYSPAIQLAGEAKNPQRAIPFAILGSIVIAIVLYAVLEIAFVGAVSPASLTQGWSHMHFTGDSGPIAGILTSIGIFWLLKIIYIDAVISPLGTGYIYTASTARINIAMSQNGYMPKFMQTLNRHHSPIFAIGINFIIGLIFFLPFPGWQSMVSFIVSCFVVAYAIGPISCATLRKTMPNVKRPFKIPAVTTVCLIAFFICNMIVFWTGWGVVWKMLVTIGIGYIVLFLQRILSKETSTLDWRKGIWVFPYLIGLGIIAYLGTFGGINVIPFGYDFIVIAIFSVVLFYSAVFCGTYFLKELVND